MKVLQNVQPTPEQLPIIQRSTPGVTVIRGAAGSGKTTTALLRMKVLAIAWINRHRRLAINRPVQMLVITYNRTLRGYIEELARNDLNASAELNIEIKTFAKWATESLGIQPEHDRALEKLKTLARPFGVNQEFVCDEAQYLLGRFLPYSYDRYLDSERRGRGRSPRCDRSLRQRILDGIIFPYQQWKEKNNILDFNDLAVKLALTESRPRMYDILVADETQDLSANEIRALLNFKAQDHSITFVLDAAQRIYSKGFTWREVGINLQPTQSYQLVANHRNTRQIAAFTVPLLDGVDLGSEDGSFPNWNICSKDGPKPTVIVGEYSKQVQWALDYLNTHVNLKSESVSFLKPKGGKWFDYLRIKLNNSNLPYVELTRNSEWPLGPENIALSTMHSAKGLEFDHVLIIGLNEQVTPHGVEPGDNQLDTLRRLLAMALGRARKSVVLGYKRSEASSLVTYLQKDTYIECIL